LLAPDGALVTSADPFINIPNYPEIAVLLKTIAQFPVHRIVNAGTLAKEAGLAKAVNMVMVGAASSFLPISAEYLKSTITGMFASKEASIIEANRKAFNVGRGAVL
jgi:indolepyruvate ferredoxin oxidoreductase beta subunit